MSERFLELSNFRNIGISSTQKLVLGTTVDKDLLGDVIYLVGPNNAGKSNCLDALEEYANSTITKFDIPEFLNSNPEPKLKFVVRTDDVVFAQEKSLSKQSKTSGFHRNDTKIGNLSGLNDNTKRFMINIAQYLSVRPQIVPQNLRQELSAVIGGTMNISVPLLEFFDEFITKKWSSSDVEPNISTTNADAIKYFAEFRNYQQSPIETAFLDQYGYKLIPNIFKIKLSEYKQSLFNTNIDSIDKSDFFMSLLRSIDFDVAHIRNAYIKYRERSNRGLLVNVAEEINEKLTKISAVFNSLYFLEKSKYRFEMIIESNMISFQIYLGKTSLTFDNQSSGFRWFFNFFFTLISKVDLAPGDIVILDEPATNLHVKGIEELRDFVQDFAQRNKVTFIISTHSPFFINIDYLENVRTIFRSGNESFISSKFHVLDKNDIDSLRPITKALTVSRHILMNPLKKTIFVEGITDYCYLSAMKKVLKNDNLCFLPINGLNDDDNPTQLKPDDMLFKTLKSIDRYPTLLVDSDKAGFDAKSRAEKGFKGEIEVLSLNEVPSSKKFNTIEDLFSDKFRPQVKSFAKATELKRRILSEKIDKESIDNFKLLFDYLEG